MTKLKKILAYQKLCNLKHTIDKSVFVKTDKLIISFKISLEVTRNFL